MLAQKNNHIITTIKPTKNLPIPRLFSPLIPYRYCGRMIVMKNKIKIRNFKKDKKINNIEEVSKIENRLKKYLEREEIYKEIQKLNIKGGKSIDIQNVFVKYLQNIGFNDEKKGLFKEYLTKQLRPDYYKKIGKGGILIEVERGQTIQNNNDLRDLWKCHICKDANHLFLIVPISMHHTPNCFERVCNRLHSFFEKGNYTNVDSLTIFGY